MRILSIDEINQTSAGIGSTYAQWGGYIGYGLAMPFALITTALFCYNPRAGSEIGFVLLKSGELLGYMTGELIGYGVNKMSGNSTQIS